MCGFAGTPPEKVLETLNILEDALIDKEAYEKHVGDIMESMLNLWSAPPQTKSTNLLLGKWERRASLCFDGVFPTPPANEQWKALMRQQGTPERRAHRTIESTPMNLPRNGMMIRNSNDVPVLRNPRHSPALFPFCRQPRAVGPELKF